MCWKGGKGGQHLLMRFFAMELAYLQGKTEIYYLGDVFQEYMKMLDSVKVWTARIHSVKLEAYMLVNVFLT